LSLGSAVLGLAALPGLLGGIHAALSLCKLLFEGFDLGLKGFDLRRVVVVFGCQTFVRGNLAFERLYPAF